MSIEADHLPTHFWTPFLRNDTRVTAAPHYVWEIIDLLNSTLEALSFEVAPMMASLDTRKGLQTQQHSAHTGGRPNASDDNGDEARGLASAQANGGRSSTTVSSLDASVWRVHACPSGSQGVVGCAEPPLAAAVCVCV